jgi:hypothetical protein
LIFKTTFAALVRWVPSALLAAVYRAFRCANDAAVRIANRAASIRHHADRRLAMTSGA